MRNKPLIADYETSTGNIDGSTNVYLWGISSLDKKDRYIGVTIEEFFATIRYYELPYILFHNLKFDGKFIIHHLIEQGYSFADKPFQTPEEPNTFTMMQTDTSIIYSLVVNMGGHVVKFGDSARLLVSSVDDMGKVLGLPKLMIDYDKYKHFDHIDDVPSMLVDYLWRDIDIVIDFYNQFSSTYKGHGITLGSTAMKNFKKHYGNNEYVKNFGGYFYHQGTKKKVYNPILTLDLWNEFKASYRGGLTVFRQDYTGVEIDLTKHNGYSVDYNSHYPAQMMNNRLPVGTPYEYPIYDDGVLQMHKIYINKATKKEDILPAIIPSNYNVSKYEIHYMNEVEDEYYNIWSWELEVWEKFYDMDYRIVKTWWVRSEYVFRTWVEKMKHLKENAKNDIDKLYAKTILNSLYGKWGQNHQRAHRVIVHDPFKDRSGTRYGEYVEEAVLTDTEDLSYIPMASAITAYARTKLCEDILANKDTFIYADTDSMYLTGKAKDIEIHETRFGAMKYEKRFTRFKFIKPKAYIAELVSVYKGGEWIEPKTKNHIALAGLSKENHSKLNFENFNRGHVVQNGKLQGKNVAGGIRLIPINYTL